MPSTKFIRLLISLCLACSGAGAHAAELPGDSIYHIESNWVDQDRVVINIGELQGRLQLVAFVYTYCEHSCPFILANLQKIQRALPDNARAQLQFSLISLDPERDSPEVLKRYMQDHGLSAPNWQMLNGDEDDVLELSALIGVRYKAMDNEAQDISHSNMITLLDKQGRIIYQLKGLNQDIEDLIDRIAQQL